MKSRISGKSNVPVSRMNHLKRLDVLSELDGMAGAVMNLIAASVALKSQRL